MTGGQQVHRRDETATSDVVPAPSPMRRRARAAAQAVGSALLLAVACYGVDWRRLADHVGEIDWGVWILGAGLVTAAPVASSVRTWALLRGVVGRAGLGRVTRLNYGAMRFVFLPGGDILGGVYRWYAMTRWGWARSKVLSVLLVERALDLAILAAVVAVVVPFGSADETPVRIVWWGSLAALGTMAVLACLVPTIARRCAGSDAERPGLVRAARRVAGATAEAVATTFGRPAVAAPVLASSFAYWGVALLGGSLLARGATPGLDVGGYLVTLCVVALAAQLPISVAGVGLREAAMRVLMARHGVTAEQAVLVGASALVPYAVAACIGVVVAWRDEKPTPISR
jgi:glycosyltransferase 2 family protein